MALVTAWRISVRGRTSPIRDQPARFVCELCIRALAWTDNFMVRALAGDTEALHAPIGGVRREHYEQARRNVQQYAMLATLPSSADEPRDMIARREAFEGAPLHWTRLELLEHRVNHHADSSFGEFERRWFASRNAWDMRLYSEIRARMLSTQSNQSVASLRLDVLPHHSHPRPPPQLDPPFPPASPPRPPNRPPATSVLGTPNHPVMKAVPRGFKDGFKDGFRARCPKGWREPAPLCRGCESKRQEATTWSRHG